nr:MAG TPA: Glycophorin A [Caudoviricetes sp.]DAV91308.1 MAG TPA: Glycophorin A [Caudoviricetes sp.]
MREWMLVGAYACIIVAMALIIWDIWDRRKK